MQRKDRDSSQKTSRKRTKSEKPGTSLRKATVNKPTATKEDEACDQFVKGLLVRGEAVKPTKEGKLPLNATHVVRKKNKDGTVEVKRVRYKAF